MSHREDLERELREVQATITDAYWIYTRTKRGKPPVLVVPEAYKRRREIEDELRAMRRAAI